MWPNRKIGLWYLFIDGCLCFTDSNIKIKGWKLRNNWCVLSEFFINDFKRQDNAVNQITSHAATFCGTFFLIWTLNVLPSVCLWRSQHVHSTSLEAHDSSRKNHKNILMAWNDTTIPILIKSRCASTLVDRIIFNTIVI